MNEWKRWLAAATVKIGSHRFLGGAAQYKKLQNLQSEKPHLSSQKRWWRSRLQSACVLYKTGPKVSKLGSELLSIRAHSDWKHFFGVDRKWCQKLMERRCKNNSTGNSNCSNFPLNFFACKWQNFCIDPILSALKFHSDLWSSASWFLRECSKMFIRLLVADTI